MRLGQLARKLSLKPSEIVEYLASRNVVISDGSNTRIEDEHAMMVIQNFAPDQENILKDDEEALPLLQAPDDTMPGVVEKTTYPETPALNILPAESVEPVRTDQQSELIKAPKIELPGLKVLGKIDLPEEKKRELPAPSADTTATKSVEETNSLPEQTQKREEKYLRGQRKGYYKKERIDRPGKNPVALKREREALEAEHKRKENEAREKEKRTQNYLKKVKPTQPRKAARLIDEQVIEMHDLPEEKPKTWFGRLIQWLTKAE